MAVDGGWL